MKFRILSYEISRTKSNGTIYFVLSLKLAVPCFLSGPPPNRIFFLQLVFFTFDTKISQTKTFSQKVFFIFCLELFSLNCIIKMSNLKVNDPREPTQGYTHAATGHVDLVFPDVAVEEVKVVFEDQARKFRAFRRVQDIFEK